MSGNNYSRLESPERHWPTGSTLTRISEDIHRTLPHSIEAEQGVIGSMLISPREIIGECVEKIDEEYFYVPAHQTIYVVLVELWNAQQGIDLITFTQVLRDRNLLETVGGASAVTSLFTFVPTAANVIYYLEIVRDKYILRQIIAACTQSVRQAFEEQDEVNNLLDEVLARLTKLELSQRGQASLRHVKEGVLETVDRMANAHANRGQEVISGVATGLYDVDRMLTGLKPQQLIVIAARPSHGKTAFAMNIAEHVAVNCGIPVAVFSLEMSYQELINRMVCSYVGVSLQRLRDGFFKDADFPKITKGAEYLQQAPIYIDDTPALRILELKALGRRAVTKLKCGLIVVDYLQLLVSPSRRAQENRVLEITEISGGLKAMAKELGVPVLVLAQLKRDADARGRMSRPKLSDLRESGSIEQDADVVGLLVRPIRNCSSDADRAFVAEQLKLRVEELENYAELDIAKQRNGPVGEVKLFFHDEITRFKNRTTKQWSNRKDERQELP